MDVHRFCGDCHSIDHGDGDYGCLAEQLHRSPVLRLPEFSHTQGCSGFDVFTAIGERSTDAAALATRCNAAQRGIVALCDSLVMMGFLTKPSNLYALSSDAAAFLDRRSPTCIASVHEFLAAPEMVALMFQDPAGAVRRGGASGLAYIAPGRAAFTHLERLQCAARRTSALVPAEDRI